MRYLICAIIANAFTARFFSIMIYEMQTGKLIFSTVCTNVHAGVRTINLEKIIVNRIVAYNWSETITTSILVRILSVGARVNH